MPRSIISSPLLLLLIVCACSLPFSAALDNGLGLTPQMGWNSWNRFYCNISSELIRETARALISTGLAQVGYNYVNVDDCWQVSRDKDDHDRIVADPKTFPEGMKALADYVHSLGLKFGLYSSAGVTTCQGRPGGLGYEKIDAETYAEWGVDYLKYDNCGDEGLKPEVRFPPMRDALNATGRPIFFSMCEWGVDEPWRWAMSVGNSWRTTGDIQNSWSSMIQCIDENDIGWKVAGPGQWNDPDMLEIGNGGLTLSEERVHMSLWALAKAPLILGCDLRSITQESLSALSNPEVIAINQDRLGVQGHKINSVNGIDLWSGPLSSDRYVVALVNRVNETASRSFKFTDIIDHIHDRRRHHASQPHADTSYRIRDVWARKDLGVFKDSYKTSIHSHDVVFLTLAPVTPGSTESSSTRQAGSHLGSMVAEI